MHGRPTGIEDVPDLGVPHVEAPKGWELGRMLAIGGTAIVYELAGPSPAVLKWARWRERDVRSRFQIEADVLRTVGPPATPALIDHGASDGTPYIIMERVGGETLAAWMSRAGDRGGLGEIIAILTRAAASLAALHDAGYVHRDLKPENICVDGRGVRLLDFGFAKPLRTADANLTQIGTIVGTPHYIAPEQIRTGGVVDHRADIYSLAVIMFEMLAGRPPFVGERRAIEYQHQVARPPSVRETRAIPPALDELVQRCLAKQPDARPQTALELRDALGQVMTAPGTIRGIGAVTGSQPGTAKPLGDQSEVALAWIVGGDPVAITRAIGAVHGVIARQRGDGILAAFSAKHHEAPLAIALGACRNLVRERCRVTIHTTTALVRRSVGGKPMVYGKDIQQADWIPEAPFVGLVLTKAAARPTLDVPATDVPGYFREREAAAGNTTDIEHAPTLVGRGPVVARIAAAVAQPIIVDVAGSDGAGKSRVLEAVANKLRTAGRDVAYIRARPRLLGDRADDERVLQTLGHAGDASSAFQAAAQRNLVLIVDDADQLSRSFLRRLLGTLPFARVIATQTPVFEVLDGAEDRIAIELPRLSHEDAGVLLREQLRPARLIPDVLVERLALRGAGNPRLLLALAHDMKRRGALRRHAGSDEWYVAVDELDTLLAPPSVGWLATRAMEDLPAEVVPILRMCAALGPRFCRDEIASVCGSANTNDQLAFLLREGTLAEQGGWYELVDRSLRDAIYEHLAGERELVHARALAYWLEHRIANTTGWLARVAFHAEGARQRETAAAGWIALAGAARRRDEPELATVLLARAHASLAPGLSTAVREAIDSLADD